MIISPFKVKPITGRGKLSLVLKYTPWTPAEFRVLAKEFPHLSQNPLGFAKDFELTIQTYKPRFLDHYQLVFTHLEIKGYFALKMRELFYYIHS